jgi:hypothetical protein
MMIFAAFAASAFTAPLAPETAKLVDCRPALMLMAYRDQPKAAKPKAKDCPEPKPKPVRRCVTLASA